MKTESYRVNGMSCGHCVAHVKNAVEELDGVQTVNVSLENASLEVTFDEQKLGFDDIKAAVEDAGYGLEK